MVKGKPSTKSVISDITATNYRSRCGKHLYVLHLFHLFTEDAVFPGNKGFFLFERLMVVEERTVLLSHGFQIP
jgi:hypothetical protein